MLAAFSSREDLPQGRTSHGLRLYQKISRHRLCFVHSQGHLYLDLYRTSAFIAAQSQAKDQDREPEECKRAEQ